MDEKRTKMIFFNFCCNVYDIPTQTIIKKAMPCAWLLTFEGESIIDIYLNFAIKWQRKNQIWGCTDLRLIVGDFRSLFCWLNLRQVEGSALNLRNFVLRLVAYSAFLAAVVFSRWPLFSSNSVEWLGSIPQSIFSETVQLTLTIHAISRNSAPTLRPVIHFNGCKLLSECRPRPGIAWEFRK